MLRQYRPDQIVGLLVELCLDSTRTQPLRSAARVLNGHVATVQQKHTGLDCATRCHEQRSTLFNKCSNGRTKIHRLKLRYTLVMNNGRISERGFCHVVIPEQNELFRTMPRHSGICRDMS